MRTPASRPKPRTARVKIIPAPTSGLIANVNRALPSERQPGGGVVRGAAVLDNFFPVATGIRVRGGCVRAAYTGADTPARAFLTYLNGNNRRLFAATGTAIFDITAAAPNVVPVASVSGLTSGDWIGAQIANAGGVFLVAVNGADVARNYNGTAWATTPAITGVSSAILSYVWLFKNRLFLIERDSLTLWYLATDAIGGAATAFPMAGIFPLGGSLLFGATISGDTGSGMSDRLVVVTTEGEAAIFEGSDPSNADAWSLSGVYRVGRPLGKRAHARTGGDLMIATEIGLVSLASAQTRDFAALAPAAASAPIEMAWSDLVRDNSFAPWSLALWPARQMGLCAYPQAPGAAPRCLAVNLRTGAWSRFVGWSIVAHVVFQDAYYFSTPSGRVMLGDESGMDDDKPYTSTVVPLFDDLTAPAAIKVGKMLRATATGSSPPSVQLGVLTDFDPIKPTAPDATPETRTNLWGVGVWGTARWGAIASKTYQAWQSVSGSGSTLSPVLQMTFGAIGRPDVEVVRMDFTYEVGDIVT